jgi:membrane fusion protein (multidrug efflux system)
MLDPIPFRWPALALAAALLALSPLAAHRLSAQDGAPLPAVVVAPAAMIDFQQSASFSGRLVAAQSVDIRARVSGFIEEIGFREGATVEAGSMLYVIEDSAYRATVAEIEGQLQAAEAEARLAELERDRTKTLVDRGTLSQADLDRADAAVGKAEGAIARLEAQRQRAELDLSYTRVTAPFDGVVGLTRYDVGALVGPDAGALVTLTDLDPIYAEFSIATSLLLDFQRRVAAGDLAPESTVSIRLPDGTMHDRAGTLTFLDARVAQGTDTVLLRAEFDNPDARLLDGALVQVVLAQTEADRRLAVPMQAIQRDLTGAFVLVVDDTGRVEQRRIDVGAQSRGMTAVTAGLDEGEAVIVEGINKVRPGIVVDAAMASDG